MVGCPTGEQARFAIRSHAQALAGSVPRRTVYYRLTEVKKISDVKVISAS